jgi:hypothetical protein
LDSFLYAAIGKVDTVSAVPPSDRLFAGELVLEDATGPSTHSADVTSDALLATTSWAVDVIH